MIDPQALDQLITQLIQKKGQQINDENRVSFTEEIVDRINESILRNITDEKLPEFEQILEEGDEEKVKLFIRQQIPNLEYVVMKALE
jgi:succinate dehydrogenase flavin-adding protein (antitoxin of CptAB toxin-antitoxin module)